MKKGFVLLTIFASLIFISWSKYPSSKASSNVPIKGYYKTTAQVFTPPPFLHQQITGQGQSSHLGKGSFVADAHINLTTAPPFAVSGTAVFKAANGDEFYTDFTGRATPPDGGVGMYVEIDHTITGGTGRFSNATGSFSGYTLGTPGFFSYEGYINYN
jgi:hypothetical protein